MNATDNELHRALVRLCQTKGSTTAETYELLRRAAATIGSTQPDTMWCHNTDGIHTYGTDGARLITCPACGMTWDPRDTQAGDLPLHDRPTPEPEDEDEPAQDAQPAQDVTPGAWSGPGPEPYLWPLAQLARELGRPGAQTLAQLAREHAQGDQDDQDDQPPRAARGIAWWRVDVSVPDYEGRDADAMTEHLQHTLGVDFGRVAVVIHDVRPEDD